MLEACVRRGGEREPFGNMPGVQKHWCVCESWGIDNASVSLWQVWVQFECLHQHLSGGGRRVCVFVGYVGRSVRACGVHVSENGV